MSEIINLTTGRYAGIKWDKLQLLAEGITASKLFRFDMRAYRAVDSLLYPGDLDSVCVYANDAQCGTIACALGHGPAIAGLEPKDFVFSNRNGRVMWDLYCESAFGFAQYSCPELWVWLFHFKWAKRDNTREGAVARIRFAIAHRGVPTDYSQQMTYPNRFNLSYRDDKGEILEQYK